MGGVYGDDSTVVTVMVAALGLSDGILVNDLALGSRKVDPSRFSVSARLGLHTDSMLGESGFHYSMFLIK